MTGRTSVASRCGTTTICSRTWGSPSSMSSSARVQVTQKMLQIPHSGLKPGNLPNLEILSPATFPALKPYHPRSGDVPSPEALKPQAR
jgi:hypothetical protein